MLPKTKTSRAVSSKSVGAIDDVMVKDPFCQTYFAKRNGVHLNFEGKDLYFCSAQCKDKYIAANSAKKE
jgi:YHS domain-containing protein